MPGTVLVVDFVARVVVAGVNILGLIIVAALAVGLSLHLISLDIG